MICRGKENRIEKGAPHFPSFSLRGNTDVSIGYEALL